MLFLIKSLSITTLSRKVLVTIATQIRLYRQILVYTKLNRIQRAVTHRSDRTELASVAVIAISTNTPERKKTDIGTHTTILTGGIIASRFCNNK